MMKYLRNPIITLIIKYENDSGLVYIAGYVFRKYTVCEDKEIIYDIIVNYFETGKINEKYQWLTTYFSGSFVGDANFFA